jgi:centrosomal protein POC5
MEPCFVYFVPTYIVVRMLSSSETLSTPEEPSGGEEQVEVTQLHRDSDVHGREEEDDSLRESVPRRPLVSASLLEPSQVVSEPPRDPELVHLEMQLDMWCTDMKRNILAEFAQSLLRLREQMRQEMEHEKARNQYEVHQLQCELERLRDLVATYEQGIEKKDQVISKLSGVLQKQKSKVGLQHSFSQWKLHHSEEKRENFVSKIAYKHYRRRLMLKVWLAWHGILVAKWKQRVEKACQARAEEVCVQLTNDYEEKLSVMHRSLDDARNDVQKMREERDMFAENMKKAFMRGVCALNMEAMTMFQSGSGEGRGRNNGHAVNVGGSDGLHQLSSEDTSSEQDSSTDRDANSGHTQSINVQFSSENAPLRPQVGAGIGGNLQRNSVKAAEPKQYHKQAKARKTVAKPMPAVVVEKHVQPH